LAGTSIVLVYVASDDGQIANLALDNGTCTGITAAPTSTASSISGTVTTVAGSAGISGAYDGTGSFALFNLPRGITVDSSGNLYVADTGNSAIRVVTGRGVVVTVAGIPGISGFRDGSGTTALFNQPQGMLNYFSIWVVDTGNSVLRSMPANGATVTSLALSLSTTTTPTTSTTSTGTTSGGGGAPSLWFVVLLGMLGVTRRWTARAD
jgi:streptogramin lyase